MHFRKGLWILRLEERNFKFCRERITITTRRRSKIITIAIDERDVHPYVYIQWLGLPPVKWLQLDVSFETHGNSFKQKSTWTSDQKTWCEMAPLKEIESGD